MGVSITVWLQDGKSSLEDLMSFACLEMLKEALA